MGKKCAAVMESKGYVDALYLQRVGTSMELREQAGYAQMEVQAGQQILDEGCGTGIGTVVPAQLAGPEGKVLVIEHDPAMVANADRRFASSGVVAR